MRHLIRCMLGGAAIEFAVICPFFLLLIFGGVELGRFIIINQKLEATASTMADLATQGSSISHTSLQQIAGAANIMMNPYAMQSSIIFSSAATTLLPTPPCRRSRLSCITWQYEPVGNDGSRIGHTGGTPHLPNNYQVPAGQNIIAVEMFYHFQPLFAYTANLIPALGAQTLYYTAIYKPRQGSLTTLN